VRVSPGAVSVVLVGWLGGCAEEAGRECVIGDERYADGEDYDDGCNTHYCDDGRWSVTEKACAWAVPRDPKCVPLCPIESDPAVIAEQTQCGVVRMQRVEGFLFEWRIPPCEGGVDPRVPDGFDECFILRLEAGADTPSPHDDLSQSCIDAGAAFELWIQTDAAIRWRGELYAFCSLIDPVTGWARPMTSCDPA
jgi:hypothetical protein